MKAQGKHVWLPTVKQLRSNSGLGEWDTIPGVSSLNIVLAENTFKITVQTHSFCRVEAIIGNCRCSLQTPASSKNNPAWLALSNWLHFCWLLVSGFSHTVTDKPTVTKHSWWLISWLSACLLQSCVLFLFSKEQASIFSRRVSLLHYYSEKDHSSIL